ncbi:polyketide synthase [Penicillium longicatenatum]|nr:polyketide synthase [Penicillium longicatenatum]
MPPINGDTPPANLAEPLSMDDMPALAIVGLAFEFPDEATSTEKFWEMICEGRCASSEFPKDRMNAESFYHPDESRQSTIPVRRAHFVKEDLGKFDAPFFCITPGEASCMDPQHRRMLEIGYHALENAGIPIEKCTGSDTSVYMGCFTNDYSSVLQQDIFQIEQRHAAVGIAATMLANRLSWFFNFKGTSMNIDSACSSSLVALHLACRDLLSGSSSMSLVGGANLVFHPNFMKIMSSSGLLSPDGRCWSFDERANGYARGEGTAVLVIKRVADAVRDGDTIRAIIRNTGSNQDGRTPAITQPSLESQVALIKQTYQQANIDMGPTRFFEAHGTGTPVGDPVEANSIGQAFQDFRSMSDPLFIGAVKANFGHLEGASGLAGVIKALLVLENGVIPPIAGLKSLNPRIDADKLGLHFPQKAIPWPTKGLRRACVNSFGFGGTNATVILDDAYHYLSSHGLHGYTRTRICPPSVDLTTMTSYNPVFDPVETECSDFEFGKMSKSPKLLVFSAAGKETCRNVMSLHREYLEENDHKVDVLAHTLAERRTLLPWRSFIVADPRATNTHGEWSLKMPVCAQSDVQIAFIFTGQGTQYLGMGRGLLCFPVYRNALRELQDCLQNLGASWSLHQFLNADESSVSIDEPRYSQPLTTCLQIALVDLMDSFGISPTVVLGHSSGEIAAAYAAGSLSKLSAVTVAYYRGILSSNLADRKANLSMMAVGLSVDDTIPYLDHLKKGTDDLEISIGCINSPQSVTLTGDVKQLEILRGWFEGDSVFARRLRVPISYHSPVMEEVSLEYREAMKDLHSGLDVKLIPMVSSVTCNNVTSKDLCNADYWVQNMTSPVHFEGALAKILAQGDKRPREQLDRNSPTGLPISHILEIGPHSALKGPIGENLSHYSKKAKPVYLESLHRKGHADKSLLVAVGKLHCAGYPVDLHAVNFTGSMSCAMPPGLPKYPFDHTQSYWNEGRLSKSLRFRDTARHDLLGTQILDWNPEAAQWQNTIRLNEVPWLRDHKIDDQIIFPAAAMIAMAIEAFRQLNTSQITLSSIHIKDIEFLHALIFPSNADHIETQFILSGPGNSLDGSRWSHFRLFLIENGVHAECCSGSIRGAFGQTNDIADVPFTFGVNAEEWIKDIVTACNISRNPYSILDESALQYGPSFRVLEDLQLGPKEQAVANISNKIWKLSPTSDQWNQQFTIHPCTLDGMAQIILLALSSESEVLTGMVPKRVSSVWIDCRDNVHSSGGKLFGVAKCIHRGRRSATANIVATASSSKPVVYFERLEASFIESQSNSRVMEEKSRNLCTRLKWRPDIEMMKPDQLMEEISRDRPKEPDSAGSEHDDLMLAIFCFVQEAVKFLEENPSTIVSGRFLPYLSWMKYQQSLPRNQGLQSASQQLLSSPEAIKQLIAKVEKTGVEGNFFMHVGRKLISVLRGDTDPLDLMFRNNLIDLYYEQMLANPYHSYPACFFIDQLCFKNPSMNILEVGAGTGGQTLRVLETISSHGIKRCGRYVYTDISPAFFPRAKEKFQDYADILEYKVCDISKDPVQQSFERASYDLVLASHVLHATKNIGESLRNIRTLLKPGGRLLLFETTEPEALHIGFAFGLLGGWWSPLDHELRSAHSPCLPTAQWDKSLQSSGFSGTYLDIPGQGLEKCRYSSILISTAVPLKCDEPPAENDIFVVWSASSSRHQISEIFAKNWSITFFTLDEIPRIQVPASTIVVFLVELRETFLAGISATDFDLLRTILVKIQNSIWITEPLKKSHIPDLSLIEGLSRSLASEDISRRFVTLALDGSETEEQLLFYLSKITHSMQNDPVELMETTYSSKGGIIHIPRVSENEFMNDQVSRILESRVADDRQIGPDLQASLHIRNPGELQTLEYLEDSPESLKPGKDELVINVHAIGLTWQDYLYATGVAERCKMGTECAGIVQNAGSNTSYQPGDRVCAIGDGLARTFVCVNSDAVTPIPPGMSFSQAASLPTSLWLSFYSLHKLANLEENETVLIHQAASSVGQILIQMSIKRGAHVLATVSSASEKASLCEMFDLSSDTIFISSDASLCRRVHLLTHGSGVDVVVGSLANWKGPDISGCLAAYARIIDIGINRSVPHSLWEPKKRETNVSRATVSLVDLLQHNPTLVFRVFQQAVELWFKDGFPTRPLKLNVFPADNIEPAFQNIKLGDTAGQCVIEMKQGMDIKVNTLTKPSYSFPSNASYVISGGLGGLGRLFARWMVDRGARNLILLSRSGLQIPASYEFIHELQRKGTTVATPQVDVGDFSKLKGVLANLSNSMPPIRGCIQATMALRDNLFQNMSHEDWKVSTSSKVNASWNLHLAMPTDLDFFVLVSSVNGLFGGRAQANYAAGNVFQDALAHYRISQGLKAVTIDLGMIVDEGIVAGNKFLLNSVRRFGHLMEIKEKELLALLDYYCNPRLPLLSHDAVQPVIGLEMPSVMAAKGVDLHHSIRRPVFNHLFRMGTQSNVPIADSKASKGYIDRPAALRSASADEAISMVTDWIILKISHILGLPGSDIEADKPLHAYGIDSLVAIDVKNWFLNDLGTKITVFDIMGNTSLKQLSTMVAEQSHFRQ